MIQQPDRFAKIAKKLDRSGYEFMQDGKLKSMPRGYSEHSDHSLVEYLKLKSLILHQPQPKSAWLDGSIVDELVKLAKASTDLIIFGVEAIESGHSTSKMKGV